MGEGRDETRRKIEEKRGGQMAPKKTPKLKESPDRDKPRPPKNRER